MEFTHIQKREIQIPIAKSLLEGFIEHFGKNEVITALNKIIEADAERSGKEMASRFGSNSMRGLARVVREVWAEDNAMVMDFLEETDEKLSFNVTKCRYAEAYEKNQIKELGVCLSCNRDRPFTKGFNSEMELIRTQTIMEGANFCDFRFVKADRQ
ncbi:MAG: L-2-amino-thiazoline-4-carboxylic acid hydrolase [Oligoflexia bacterium]|nr:L-2-amino-thiazoline-4-carboxylic acid hydrolase [Oligoflexia bacterium]